VQDIDSEIGVIKANYELELSAQEGLVARRNGLEAEAEELYARAKARMLAADEEGARTFLTMRQAALDKVATAGKELALSRQLCEDHVEALKSLQLQRNALLR